MRSPVLWGLLAALLMTAPLSPPALAAPGGSRNAPAREMTAVEFRGAVVAAIRARMPKARIEERAVDELQVYRDAADKDGISLYLGNIFARYRGAPADGDELIGKLVDTLVMASAEDQPPAAPGQFVILIRPDGYLSLPTMKDAKPEQKLVWRPLAGHMIQLIAIDRGKGFSMASAGEVTAAFGSTDKVWGPALANSDRTKGEVQVDQVRETTWTVTSSNDLGDTIMLLPDPWKGLGIGLKGAPVVVALQRNLLLVMDSASDAEEFAAVQDFLASVAAEGDTISTEMFIWKDGRWQVFTP